MSVRLDPQVLDWLRSKGEGHLTRIDDAPTSLMDAEGRAGAGKQGDPGQPPAPYGVLF